jgi:hypothetical protein
VHLDDALRAGFAMQAIDVLRDDGFDQPVRLELREHLVRAVRLLFLKHPEAGPVVVPEPLRLRMEDLDVGDFHRIDLLPHARPRGAKVGDPARDGDARAGEDNGAIGGTDQIRQPLRRVGAGTSAQEIRNQ